VYWFRMASSSSAKTKARPSKVRANGSAPSPGRGWRDVSGRPAFSQLMRRYLLTILVHADAARFDPLGYAQAVLWRIRGLRVRSRNKLAAAIGRSPRAYALWISKVEPAARELLRASDIASATILPVVDARDPDTLVDQTVRSLGAAHQTVIAVGGRKHRDQTHVETPKGLAEHIDPAGSWLCILPAGDEVAPDALEIYAKAAAHCGDSWLIYADDDLIDTGKRRSPHFKSAWNVELFRHHDFLSGSAVVRATPDMVADLDGEDWIDTLTKRAIERGAPPVHIPAVLHHRLRRPEPSQPTKPASTPADPAPLVSVIIPTRDHLVYLQTCVDGVERTNYPAIELIVVDNDSVEPETLIYLDMLRQNGVKVLKVEGPFNFSALNNAAVRRAQGELVCFLNNDVEIVDPDWLSLLVRQAVRPELGAIGGKLLYPDGSVQHAGVVTGVGGGAAHAHRMLTSEDPGYFMRDRLPQLISAVTGACLVLSRDKFLAVGGFNEQDFPVAFNDVDLCLKLNARGWQTLYEPRATLIHHESKSRGKDSDRQNRARFAAELAALKRHWGTDRERDPFHHPHLSPFCEQFLVGIGGDPHF